MKPRLSVILSVLALTPFALVIFALASGLLLDAGVGSGIARCMAAFTGAGFLASAYILITRYDAARAAGRTSSAMAAFGAGAAAFASVCKNRKSRIALLALCAAAATFHFYRPFRSACLMSDFNPRHCILNLVGKGSWRTHPGECYAITGGATIPPPRLEDFEAKAAAGDAEAQKDMGLYLLGTATYPQYNWRAPPDYEHAAIWFRRAAEQGNAMAAANLAKLYLKSEGVRQDFRKAYFWIVVALNRDKPVGVPRSEFCMLYREISETLSEKEREGIDRLADDWKPAGPARKTAKPLIPR